MYNLVLEIACNLEATSSISERSISVTKPEEVRQTETQEVMSCLHFARDKTDPFFPAANDRESHCTSIQSCP